MGHGRGILKILDENEGGQNLAEEHLAFLGLDLQITSIPGDGDLLHCTPLLEVLEQLLGIAQLLGESFGQYRVITSAE